MTAREYEIRAALAKCAAYDPTHFPQPSDAIVEAWMEHFESLPDLHRQELLDAVREYYMAPDRKVPQPADISRIVRTARRARRDNDEWNAKVAAAGDLKAGDMPGGIAVVESEGEAGSRQKTIATFVDKFGPAR